MRRITLTCSALVLTVLAGCRTWEPPEGETCEFEFPFPADYDVINRTTFKWHDAYLTNSPYAYRQEIAGPLAALASSTYGFRLGTDVRSLMQLGFPPEKLYRCYGKDLSYHHPKYGRNRVGYTIAARKTELPGADYDIVVVMCRGTFGCEEWISNLNMADAWGLTEKLDPKEMPQHHEGFSLAADDVMEALANYAKTNAIDLGKAKILVCGHSRGGSVANLIGSRLDRAAEGPKDSPFAAVRGENVFVYTIACPNVTIRETADLQDPKYGNIFNVISSEDLVPLLPFPEWGCGRYGHTLRLKYWDLKSPGTWIDGAFGDMKDHFREICGYEYWHMLWGDFLARKVPDIILKKFPTIRQYYWVHPAIRAEGKTTCTHDFIEMVLFKTLPCAEDQSRNISLSGDLELLASAYDNLTDSNILERKKRTEMPDHKYRFVKGNRTDDGEFHPDGRDFSDQPGLFDMPWKFTCMHATQTYVSWMKSGIDNGPAEIFLNWEEERGEER